MSEFEPACETVDDIFPVNYKLGQKNNHSSELVPYIKPPVHFKILPNSHVETANPAPNRNPNTKSRLSEMIMTPLNWFHSGD